MPDKPSMETFETGEGARIFRIPLEAFLGLWTYVHLVLFGPYRVLIDTGSGYGESNEHLEAGFREASLSRIAPRNGRRTAA